MSSNLPIKKILVLSANPKGTDPLRLSEEIREIKERLRLATRRDQFTIDTGEAVRVRDISQAMLDFKPNIVHFSGHGAGEEGLAFEDLMGHVRLVGGEALAELFSLFTDTVECVLLNSCYSEPQAEAIAQYIPYVIGMSKGIGDQAAIEFAVGFYSALGAGKPYEFAYQLGCRAIKLWGISESLTPKFHKKNGISLEPDQAGKSARDDIKIVVEIVEIWRKKVDYLQQQEAITANPAQKFELQNQIEECNQKIKDLGG